jgi:hypothetical protein
LNGVLTRHALFLVTLLAALTLALPLSAEEPAASDSDAPTAEPEPAQFEPKDDREQVSLEVFADEPIAAPTEPAVVRDEFFGAAHRMRIYEQSRLSHRRATLYSLALPGLGNLYAEQYLGAGLAFSMLTFSAIFITYGLRSNRSDVAYIGLGLAGLTYGVALGTSLRGVSAYNDVLRRSLKIEDASLAPVAPGLTLSFEF